MTQPDTTMLALLHEIAACLHQLLNYSNAATPQEQVEAEARADEHRQAAAALWAESEQNNGSVSS